MFASVSRRFHILMLEHAPVVQRSFLLVSQFMLHLQLSVFSN
jgi:hypothetical protein